MRNLYRALIALIFLFSESSFGAEIFIAQPNTSQKLNSALEYLDDLTGSLSIEDVASGKGGRFQSLTKPNYGFGFKGVRWVKFQIDLTGEIGDYWYLQQNYNHVQNWTVFFERNGAFEQVNLSEDLPVRAKQYTIPNLVIKLPRRPSGVQTYFARYEPRGHALNIDLLKMSERGFVENVHAYTITNGLFFGALIVQILYSFLLCIMLRSWVYAVYVYYLVSLTAAFVYLTGYAPVVTGQLSIQWEQIFAACSFAAIHAMTLSGRTILNLKAALPRLEKILFACEIILFAGAVGSLFMPVGLHYQILNPLILVSAILLLSASILRSVQGYLPARIYAAGWISFILVMMCYALTFIGVLPLTWFTANAIKVAAVLEATLFSIALALRFKLGSEAALKAKNAFLGMVSHELKTPLQTISSCVDIAVAHGGVIRDKSTLKKLIDATAQLEAQVSDLTDFAHLESGNLKLRSAKFDPVELLQEIVQQFQTSAAEKQLSMSTEILEPNFRADADSLRIKQILVNLIDNAIKYTPKGYIIIRMARSQIVPNSLVFEVEDSGIGISKENIKSIYQPFVQVDQSLQRRYRGIGMGLTIVKNLVSIMKGHIEVDSAVGKGTVFTVSIPFLPVCSDDTNLDDQIAHSLDPSKELLLVDDEPAPLELLGQVIKSLNYNITCCSSGRSALFFCRVRRFAAILLDVNMPDLDGITVAKRLRESDFYRNIPIVWISATRPSAMEKDACAVFSHFLEKPVRAADLQNLLDRI